MRPVRELDLLLREARHRLVAHRVRAHGELIAWQMDGTIALSLVDPGSVDEAHRLLSVVNSRLPMPRATAPPSYDAFVDLRDWIFSFAAELDSDSRKKVRDALRLAGYETYHASRTVAGVLSLVAAGRSHPRVAGDTAVDTLTAD